MPEEAKVQPKERVASGSGKSKTPSSSIDRLAILQKKVAELELIHSEDKRSHLVEIDRYRADLKRNLQASEKLEKLTKTHSAFEAQHEELKKANLQDKSTIKDLRLKLRLLQNEKAQLAGKQGEKDDAKNALHALEARRKEELKDRDRRMMELEKLLANEKKKREAAEIQVTTKEVETAVSQREVIKLRTDIDSIEHKSSLALRSATEKEAIVLVQLEQHRALLSRVAEDYGKLATSTVPISVYQELKNAHTMQNLQMLKLERRLANSEGQVTELAHLIRQMQDSISNGRDEFNSLHQEISFLRQIVETPRDWSTNHNDNEELAILLHDIYCKYERMNQQANGLERFIKQATVTRYTHLIDSALLCYSAAIKILDESEDTIQNQNVSALLEKDIQKALQLQLNNANSECSTLQQRCTALTRALDKAQVIAKENEDVRKKVDARNQILRMTEDGLRAEVEQLTQDITDAERYKEAYFSYVEQVGVWADSTTLAEQEAERLACLNAEILGHHNPSQRIMYVDRIRKELADAKHRLLVINREKANLAGNNEVLMNELEMYKSVMVVDKPRTAITRIERAPLLPVNGNIEPETGSMTIDELR